MDEKLVKQLNVRLDASMSRRLNECAKATGIDATILCRSGLEAILSYFEKHRTIAFPIEIRPKPSDGK